MTTETEKVIQTIIQDVLPDIVRVLDEAANSAKTRLDDRLTAAELLLRFAGSGHRLEATARDALARVIPFLAVVVRSRTPTRSRLKAVELLLQMANVGHPAMDATQFKPVA